MGNNWRINQEVQAESICLWQPHVKPFLFWELSCFCLFIGAVMTFICTSHTSTNILCYFNLTTPHSHSNQVNPSTCPNTHQRFAYSHGFYTLHLHILDKYNEMSMIPITFLLRKIYLTVELNYTILTHFYSIYSLTFAFKFPLVHICCLLPNTFKI